MEAFSKNIITLSNTTKINLTKYIGVGTSRDYRIKAPELQAALEKQNVSDPTEESYVTADSNESGEDQTNNDEERMEVTNRTGDESNDEITVNNDAEDSMEVDDSDKENESENDENVPPKKKARKSKN